MLISTHVCSGNQREVEHLRENESSKEKWLVDDKNVEDVSMFVHNRVEMKYREETQRRLEPKRKRKIHSEKFSQRFFLLEKFLIKHFEVFERIESFLSKTKNRKSKFWILDLRVRTSKIDKKKRIDEKFRFGS